MDAELLTSAIGGIFRWSNVIASWLLTYALHSTIWILAAWLLASRRFLRQAPATQHIVWSTSLAAGFLTATLQLSGVVSPFTGRLRVAEQLRQTVAAVVVKERGAPGRAPTVRLAALFAPARDGALTPVAGNRVHRLAVGGMPEGDPFALRRGLHSASSPELLAQLRPEMRASQSPAPYPASYRAPHPTFFRTMVIAPPPSLFAIVPWFLVAAALLARLAWSQRVLRRSLGDRRHDGGWPAGVALRHLRRAAGVRRDVSLVVTEALVAPAAVSMREIALPSRLLAEFTPLEQEGVLAHELAHVVRRDTLWLRLALVMECVAWFQPLNRLARRRMQLAAEFAADAWAVRVTRQPLGLARALARIAEWVIAPVPAVVPTPLRAVLGADGSPLVQRVRRLTAPHAPDAAVSRQAGTAAFLSVATAAALLVTLPSIAVGGASPARSFGARAEVRVLLRTAERTPSRAPSVVPDTTQRVIRNN